MNDPVRILLVEDNDADVYLMRKALTAADLSFELVVIEDGGRAMAFIRNEEKYADSPVPNLAIIDLSLPKHDGIQLVEAIRQAERFADVPVVLVSSSAKPPAHVNLEQLRVARYIAKPPDLESFLQLGAVLKEILLQSEARRAGL
jgi:CheY-like chemotaxis protein